LEGGRDDLITSVKRECFVSPFCFFICIKAQRSQLSSFSQGSFGNWMERRMLRDEEDALIVIADAGYFPFLLDRGLI